MPKAAILIVEDEAITSLDMQGELARLGYQVAGAAFNGEEALKMAENLQPDLVLMDINLPGKLDGIRAALHLKEQSGIPVIFVTAMVDEATIQRTKPCEPYGYIIKPVRQDDLRTAIEHALYRREIEENLRLSEVRFRELFETSLDGIVVTDVAGVILDCNRAFSDLVGYAIEELTGMSVLVLTPPEFLPFEKRVMQEWVVESTKSFEFIKEFFHQNGARIPVSIRVWLRKGPQNQPVGYWAIVRDLTKARESEQIIVRQAQFSQKLARLTAMLNSQLDFPALLDKICLEIAQAMDVDVAVLTLVDPDQEDITAVHSFAPKSFDGLSFSALDYHKKFISGAQPYCYLYDLQEELAQPPGPPTVARDDVRSAMLLNLVCEARWIGMLDLATLGRPRRFSEDEISLLLTFANQAAIAIDRALLYQQARDRADELEILGQLSTKLRMVENPQEMLPILLTMAMALLPADAGIIYLLGPAGNPVESFKASHLPIEGEWFSTGSLLWAKAMVSETALQGDLNPAGVGEGPAPHPSGNPLTSAILIPLRSLYALPGMMVLGFTRPVKIEARLRQILSSIAEMGGNALHRSGLMEMLEKRVAERSGELDILYDLSIFINSPIQFGEKLSGALRKIMASVGADCGVIYRYEAQPNQLELITQHNLPGALLSEVHTLTLVPEITYWLETSTIPWLVNKGNSQQFPLKVTGAGVFQSVINLPIRFEGKALGLICILWEEKTDLSPENIALLIALTERISSVVQNEILRQKSENAALLEERHRLARELHDSVTQSLYSQSLLAEAAGDMLTQNMVERLESCLVDLRENSLQALKEMRLLLFELRPPLAGEQDLASALRNRLDAVERRAGVLASLDVQGAIALPAEVQKELYSIALEALNNSLKHSGAKTVKVILHPHGQHLELAIEDNGKGFYPEENLSAGMGLTTMRDRADQLGAELEIVSSPGHGAKVIVRLKVEED